MQFLSNILLSSSLCVVVLCFCVYNTEALHNNGNSNRKIPALIAFGDSTLDTGNNNYITTITKCDFSPYGRDFNGGTPTGRFCNGRVITDLLAEGLKIKSVVPAYLDPNLQTNDLLSGVNFASGGSGLDPLTSSLQQVLSMDDQVNLFKEYIGKLKAAVGEEKAKGMISNALILVSAGNNDIAITYSTGLRALYGFPTYSTMLVNRSSSFLKDLYNLGARRFAVLSTLPLGCLPSVRNIGGLFRSCQQFINDEAETFNAKLAAEVNNLSSSLPGSKMVFVDVYRILLDLIQNSAALGFTNVETGCCGTGTIEVGFLCNQLNPFTCPDASKYVFWDAAHPTESSNRFIVSRILHKYGSSF